MALVAVLCSACSHIGFARATRCRVCSPAPVAIANNVLKAARHGTRSLSATMLFGETLTANL
jgi:hypothetical protein